MVCGYPGRPGCLMSKSNETSNLSHDTLDDHRPLADTELDAVTGGIISGGSTDMRKDWVDTSDTTARRPLGTICNVGWTSTKPVTVTVK
jgi:hypothetical protein